jgi:alkylation response protein AidB-like acyl-CoA dehydrogenase
MNFSWSKEQLILRDASAKFAEQNLNLGLIEREEHHSFSKENWQKCAEFGIQGLSVPKSYGGSGKDLLDTISTLEGLGYGCRDNGLLFALCAQMWAVQTPLITFGTEAQKQQFLPKLIKGEIIGAHAISEFNAGSDMSSLQTRAIKDGTDYLISGCKTWITNAPIADLFVVTAKVDNSQGMSGLTAFIIEKNTPGLSVTKSLKKMGLKTATMGELLLDKCRIPQTNILGKEGSGMAIFAKAMSWERAFILAPALGSMQRQIEQCINYANSRHQFSKPIGKNQVIANKIVDMQMRLETSRLMLYKSAWLKTVGKRSTWESSAVKLHLSENWVQNCQDALQIHGAKGYMIESGIECDLRDALASKIYSGTSEIQRNIIASYIGL